VLPLSALTLWGCFLLLGVFIHPTATRSELYLKSLPFVTDGGPGIDYYQFWIVGRAVEQRSVENIYAPQDRQHMADLGREVLRAGPRPSDRLKKSVEVRAARIETFSTPFLYAVVNAVTTGRYDADYDRFLDLGLAATVVSVVLLARVLKYSTAEGLLFAAVMLLWCEPLSSDLRVGNVNQLQLLGVALYLFVRSGPGIARVPHGRRVYDVLGGLTLGLLVAFKPTLVVVPLALAIARVIDRRWDTLWAEGIAAVVAAGLAVGAGCLYLRSASAWWQWKDALADLEKVSDVSVANGNYTLARAILESNSPGFDVAPVLLMLGLAFVAAVLIATRRQYFEVLGKADEQQVRFERDYLVTAIGCGLSVLTLKLAWLHYYLLLVPLLLYVLRPGGWRPAGARAAAGLALALLALAATFGRPLAVLFEPAPATMANLHIAGAWGLLLLGLAAMWVSARDRQQLVPSDNRGRGTGKR
jgi:hypothetical protein